MVPLLFRVWSTFHTGMGESSFERGRWFFFTKSQSTQDICAPLSISAWVSTTFMVCVGEIIWIGIRIDLARICTAHTVWGACVEDAPLFKNPGPVQRMLPSSPQRLRLRHPWGGELVLRLSGPSCLCS